MFDSNQQWITTALALIRQCKGDEARIEAIKLTEDCTDMRSVAVDVRNHHDYVARLQVWIGTEACEQLIVEDFHFALGAMGDVETNGFVLIEIDRRPELAGFIQGAQFKDVVLELVEHGLWLAITEQVDAPITECRAVAVGIVVAVEQIDVVPPLLAPCRQ